ncbi:hypothetical protein RJ639_023875 [Escallonia herrerae]|uniref:Uncharacterized protein n=1 Tax=Escallonia herrerae TaxID=1293975 RepID=A0AA89AE65_9ASTE|nr:hypothetical protein RJ639_023875 [Escallonia herrerae]
MKESDFFAGCYADQLEGCILKPIMVGVNGLEGPAGNVTSVSYHPKDSCMITSSVDGTIRVWKT